MFAASNATTSDAGLLFTLVRPEDAAYNPEEPLRSFAHSPLFKRFRPFWSSSFDSSWVVDFLGTHTAYEYDCENIERYRIWHLSRRIPCARQDLFRSTGVTDVVLGELPIVDEEYFEWLPLLRSVTRFADFKTPKKRPFAVVEFGARYGTWAVRGGMAARRLLPDHPAQLLAVEADQTCHRWLLKHLQVNGFDTAAAVRGFVSENDGTAAFSAWEKDSPTTEMVPSFSVAHLLTNFTVVDIIHCDIQGAESAFLQEATLSVLQKKVVEHYLFWDTRHGPARPSGGYVHLERLDRGGKYAIWWWQNAWPAGDDRARQIRILWDGMLTVENPALVDY
jgi:FkbM family methyltransferase